MFSQSYSENMIVVLGAIVVSVLLLGADDNSAICRA